MKKSLKWFAITMAGFCLGILTPAVCPAIQSYELAQNVTGPAGITTIFIQNLSPYQITVKPNASYGVGDPVTSSTQNTILVPIGYPTALPATVYPSCSARAYTSPAVPMVVTFQDYNTPAINLLQLNYIISQVSAKDNQDVLRTADVPFRLYFSHTPPPAPDKGSMKLLWSIFKEVISTLDVVLDPESRLAWIAFTADTIDLINDASFPDNNKNQNSPSIPNYIGAYAVMDFEKETPSVLALDGSLANTDAIAVQAGQSAAPANGIIVTVSTVRGRWGQTGADTVPYTFVTIYDAPHFTTAGLSLALKAAAKAGSLQASPVTAGMAARVEKGGRVALLEIANAMKNLTPQKYAALNGAIANIRAGKVLADNETAVLDEMGTQADKLMNVRATDCPSGACTMPDGTCTQTKRLDCQGKYNGDGAWCPTGACFKDANTCTMLTQVACKAIPGASYNGDNTSCPSGACYYQSTQTCEVNLTQDTCNAKNGNYFGNGSDCNKGACYLQDNCSVMFAGLCKPPSIYHGGGTACGAKMTVSATYVGAKIDDPSEERRGFTVAVQNPFAALTYSKSDNIFVDNCTGPMLFCGFGILLESPQRSTALSVSDGKSSFNIKAVWGMDLPQTSFTAKAVKKECTFTVPVNYASGALQVTGADVAANTCNGSQGDTCNITLKTSVGTAKVTLTDPLTGITAAVNLTCQK